MNDRDDALLRWRLALGPSAEKVSQDLALDRLSPAASALDVDPARAGDLDQALSFVYEEKAAGLARTRPYLPKWLRAVREFFSHEVVALVQKDAIEKKGLTQLLFEPETLPLLERNVDLVATLVAAKGLIPDEARETARALVREVVEDVRRRLEIELRTAVLGALRRDRRSVVPVLRNLDWRRTIASNLKGWDARKRRLVPERIHFFARQRRRHEIDVALLVDQSGSMAESVVYSSILAAILASIDVLRTRLLFFDTDVVDATPLLDDPVDVLFSAQLGGGTDIARAVAYAEEHFVERPDRTILVLVTDLCEGGKREDLVARADRLVQSGVRFVCLLALSDDGKPAYDHELARALAEVGVACFGCSPRKLPEVFERVMKRQSLEPLVAKETA